MRICIGTNSRPHEGGMTSYINSIAEGFRKIGHEAEIISIFGAKKSFQTKNKLIKISDAFLEGNDWCTYLIYQLSKLVLFFILFYNYLKKKYDLIYATDESVLNASRWLKKWYGVPLILNIQSSMLKDLLNQKKIKKNGFVYRYFLKEEIKGAKNADCIIANSSYSKNYVESIASQHAPIFIQRNLINEKIFHPHPEKLIQIKKSFGIPEDKFIIFCPARLVERKGVIYPLLALIELLKEKDDYYLVYAGDGPEGEKLSELSVRHHLQNNIKFLGSISYQKMGEIYNIGDVAVIPSITVEGLEEPLGITALEAMACGVPLIASEIGGLKEIIKHGHNGLLVPEKNSKALAGAIRLTRQNKTLRENLVRNGLEEINQNYTTKKVASYLIDIFSKWIKS